MSTGVVEATAPCRVDLGGGTLGEWPRSVLPPGAIAVSVAIDRRAWCRVETGVPGVCVESKDVLQKATAATVAELIVGGRLPLVAELLRALDVETGVRVETHSRVPFGSGLGASSAVAVAVGAAVSRAWGRNDDPEDLWSLLQSVLGTGTRPAWGTLEPSPAIHGGVQAVPLAEGQSGPEALSVDPARVEESLLLIDAGEAGDPKSAPREPGAQAMDMHGLGDGDGDGDDERAPGELATVAFLAGEIRQALLDDRLEDIVDLFAAEWDARKRLDPEATTPQLDRVAQVARAAGGAAKPCGPGGRGVAAVWAPPGARGPGRREAVSKALAAAGFRAFRARVDLRGLEVSERV